jgi:hypothetical protein
VRRADLRPRRTSKGKGRPVQPDAPRRERLFARRVGFLPRHALEDERVRAVGECFSCVRVTAHVIARRFGNWFRVTNGGSR